MRTKALLCAAALAAGAATSMAQNVYSLNIVGYVNVPIKTGFNLVANPLDNGTNTLDSLFPGATIGDAIYAYGGTGFTSSTYFGSWSPNLTLLPGSGIFYQASGPFTNTFVGNVMTGNLTNPVPSGFSIKSSQVPIADTLANLQFPANLGDAVYFYRNGAYVSSTYFGSWSPDLTVGIGESFWAQVSANVNWTRTFNP